MHILIVNGKAQQLFPDEVPEIHPDLLVIRDYVGQVEQGWVWTGTEFVEPTPEVSQEPPITLEELLLALEEDNKLPTSLTARVETLKQQRNL